MPREILPEILQNIFKYVPVEDEPAFAQCSILWYAIQEVHYKIAINRDFNIAWQTLEELYGKDNLDTPLFIYERLAFIKKWRMRGHAMPSIIPSSEDTSFCIFLKALPQEKNPDSQYLNDACFVGNARLVASLLQRGAQTTSNTLESALLSGSKRVLEFLYPSGDALVQASNESNLQIKLEKIFTLAAMRRNPSYIKYLHEELLIEIFRTHQDISLDVRSHTELQGLIARNEALVSPRAYLEKILFRQNRVDVLNQTLKTLLTSYSFKELRSFLLPNKGELLKHPMLMALRAKAMLEITVWDTDYIKFRFNRLNFSQSTLLNKERMMELAISHNNQALIADLAEMNIVPSWEVIRTILAPPNPPFPYDARWRLKLLKAARLREAVSPQQLSELLIASKEIPSDALNIVIYISKECLTYLSTDQADGVIRYLQDQLGLVKGEKAPLITLITQAIQTVQSGQWVSSLRRYEAIEILSLLSEWSTSKVETGSVIKKINTLSSFFEDLLAEKKREYQTISLSLSQNTQIVERNKPLIRPSLYGCSHSWQCKNVYLASLLYVWLKHHNLQKLHDSSIVNINDWKRSWDRDNFTLELPGHGQYQFFDDGLYLCGRAIFINAIIHNNLPLLQELRAWGNLDSIKVEKVALIAILERLALAMFIPAVVILAALSTQNVLIPLGSCFIICLILLFTTPRSLILIPPAFPTAFLILVALIAQNLLISAFVGCWITIYVNLIFSVSRREGVSLISDAHVLREYSLSTLFSIAWGKKIDPQTDVLQTDTLKASFQIQNLEKQKKKVEDAITHLEQRVNQFQEVKEAFSGYPATNKVGFFKPVDKPSCDSISILTTSTSISI